MWKGSFLLGDLLEDIKRLCEGNGIEEFIISVTRNLERRIIDIFLKKIHFIQWEILIVQSSDVNHCQYIVAVLKGKDLNISSARKLLFAIN